MRCVVFLLLAVFLVAGRSSPAPAQDLTKKLKLVEFPAWLTKNSGPEKAKGVIYFIRGWGGVTTGGGSLDEFRLVPYFVKALADNGWDVIGAKFPNTPTKRHSADFVPAGVTFVEARVKELKSQGYKRVVLAGHSWGAWVSMAAAKDGSGVDAVMAMAPNSYGPKIVPGGHKNPRFAMNVSEFGALTRSMKVPTILMLFAGDEFEDGDRGKIAKEQFAKNKIALLTVDKPQAFTGHFAGWLPIFDYAYGPCIQSFLDAPKAQDCALAPLSNTDVRSIFRIGQVAGADDKLITSAAPLLGKKFVAYPIGAYMRHYDYVAADKRHTMVSITVFDEAVDFHDKQQCARKTCSKLVRWSDRDILEFDPDKGSLRAWWFEQ
jgi:dienelactone hydrolase